MSTCLWCRKWAFRLALRRPAPNEIPMSHNLQGRNYFTVYLGEIEERWRLRVESVQAECVNGYWHENGAGHPASVPNSLIHTFSFRIIHYYKELQLEYRSPIKFIFDQFFFGASLKLAKERCAQFFFNQRALVRRDRIQVVRLILDRTLQDRNYRTSEFGMMTMLYGPRWVQHPNYRNLANYYRIVLDSLVVSGDLSRADNAYALAPQAFVTLADFEQDEQRHRDQIRHQKVLGALTAALVVVGLLQVAVNFFIKE